MDFKAKDFTFLYTFSLGLTAGVLIFFFMGPTCDEDVFIPPFLYGSLFAEIGVLLLAILIDNIIFSISLKGSIVNEVHRRKWLPTWLFVRIGFAAVEVICVIVCMLAVFSPASYATGPLISSGCYEGPLAFAKAVQFLLIVTFVVYFILYVIYLDPCGLCCSPSLQEDLESLLTSSEDQLAASENTQYARETRLGKLHRSHVGYGRIYRRLKGLFCCYARNHSHTTALREMALAFHTIFSDQDRVPFDLVAGLKLLGRYQENQQKMSLSNDDMDGYYLHKEFRQVA